jgi:hypothetical protein
MEGLEQDRLNGRELVFIIYALGKSRLTLERREETDRDSILARQIGSYSRTRLER